MRYMKIFIFLFVTQICMAEPLVWYPSDSLFFNAKTGDECRIIFNNTVSTKAIIIKDFFILFPFDLKINVDKIWVFPSSKEVNEDGYQFLEKYSSSLENNDLFVVCGKYNFLYLIRSEYGYSGSIRNVSLSLTQESWNNIIQNQNIRRGRELVLDKGGEMENRPEYMGTYNFDVDDTFNHTKFDIAPWVVWGNSPDDSTAFDRRLEWLAVDGIKAKLEAHPNKWKIEMDIYRTYMQNRPLYTPPPYYDRSSFTQYSNTSTSFYSGGHR